MVATEDEAATSFCAATVNFGRYSIFVIIKMYWPRTVNMEAAITAPAETEKISLSKCHLVPSPAMKNPMHWKPKSCKTVKRLF